MKERIQKTAQTSRGDGAAAAAGTPQADAGATQTAAQAQKCAGRSSRISTRVGWRRAEECPAERQSGRNGGAEIFW